jgi:hypothetical protein
MDNKDKYKDKFIDKVFESKAEYHADAGMESIEKKIEKLIKLQEMSYAIMKSTGRELSSGRVWKIKSRD